MPDDGVRPDDGVQANSDTFVETPGEVWVAPLNAAAPGKGFQRVEAWLFKDGDQRMIYRRVWTDIATFSRGQQ